MVVELKTQLQNLKGHTYWQWLFGTIASLGFLVYGLEAAWLSPTTKHLQSADSPLGYPLSNSAISWIGSINCFSSAFFVIAFSYSADRFGRKWVVFAITIPVMLSILLRLFVPNIIALLIARALAGSAASGVFVIIPMYIRELSQTNLVGATGSLNILLQNMGFLIMYLIGAYFEYYTVLWIYLTITILMACLITLVPDSPAYLVKRGRLNEAFATVAFLRGRSIDDKEVKTEIESMQQQEEQFKNQPKLSLKEIFKNKAWRRGFILLLASWVTQTWNGSFAIVTYASIVLQATGSNLSISPEIQSVSFPIIMIIASFTLTAIAERCGRKPLHAGAYLLSSIAHTGLGVSLLIQQTGYPISSWLPILCMILAVATYAGGVRSMPYIISVELFNFQVRAKLLGLLHTFGWSSVSTQLFAFGPLVDSFGLHYTFILFGVINLLGACIAMFIPETRGKTEEEVMGKLDKKRKCPS
ncbi:unnamed protein product [Pieris macdunnoughi]|uniref:Major facilitator superfamily (MFS) profile domain-containing protein n=1 Tax=Pieris macdunnoughi TaxID=345717 RepID=A0A821THI3_9NEOP|nr:unnamed protein product [Pieris macdunnoughi]